VTEFRVKRILQFKMIARAKTMNTQLQQTILDVTLIVIGDEILNGRTSDLNGTWLSKFLFQKGLNLKSMRFIRDHEREMLESIKASFLESDIVITSGGIGPTLDDKTKKVWASFFNKKIIERDDVAQIVTNNYLNFGRVWEKTLNHYHFFPEDFIAIKNPKGLAPGLGFYDSKNDKLLLSGPGVPREFQAMNEEEFFPIIKQFFGKRLNENQQVVVRTQGVPEEKIFNHLCPTLWSDLEQFGKVSSLPHTIGIDIVVSFYGNEETKNKKEKLIQNIFEKSAIKENVWQYGNKNLSELVLETALKYKVTFGFAESCTGGLTSSKITDLSGSSEVFKGSIISYANEIKMNQLNVKEETLKSSGAVSEECAYEMALGALHHLNVDYCISLSGIAGPGGGSTDKPVGTVCIGATSRKSKKTISSTHRYPGDRLRLKDRFSDKGLLTLLELIRSDFE
jgi:nicotinamide-nucleotide amidase